MRSVVVEWGVEGKEAGWSLVSAKGLMHGMGGHVAGRVGDRRPIVGHCNQAFILKRETRRFLVRKMLRIT